MPGASDSFAGRVGTRRDTLAAGALVALALLVVWLAVWRHDPGRARDLVTEPDAPEYLAGAVALVERGDYTIHVAGSRLPPRYPPGFSVVLVPWLAAGIAPERAPAAASGLAAFALLALVFAACLRHGGRVAGGVAALLVATTPGFLTLAAAPMADLTSAVFVTAAGWALWRYGLHGGLGTGAAGAVLLGLSLCVRLGNALFLPVLLAAWVLGAGRGRRLVLHGAVLAACVLAGAAPLLVYNAVVFGSPLASGYGFWLANRSGFADTFGAGYLLPNLKLLGRDLLQLEWKPTVATTFGNGSYFGPSLPLALAAALLWRPPRGRIAVLAAASGVYGVVMLFYFYPDPRFLLPLLPLVAVAVAVRAPTAWAAGWTPRTLAVLLLGAHVLGVPGSGAFADVVRFCREAPSAAAPRRALLEVLGRQPPGLVLCSFSPPHAAAILGAEWVVAPARDTHDYSYNPAVFRFGAGERRALVARERAAGRPVYLLADAELSGLRATVGSPHGARWEVWHTGGRQRGGIARLVAD